MKNKVYAGQNFCDKVVENTGSIENVVAMAIANNTSITQELVVNSELKVTPVTNKQVVALFFELKKPATALSNRNFEIVVPDGGIGAMIIESTFIVQ